MSNLPPKILVVDDDAAVTQGVQSMLVKYNVKVEKANDLESALYIFNSQIFEVVLVEEEFGPLMGTALIQKWREHESVERQATAFVLITGNMSNSGSASTAGILKELGDINVMEKPIKDGRLLSMISKCRAVAERSKKFLEFKTKVIDYYSKSGDFDKAAEKLATSAHEFGTRGYRTLFNLYEQAEKYDSALNALEPLLQDDPKNIEYLNSKGRMLMRLGKFDLAKKVLEIADQLAPNNIERCSEMADMYLELDDPDKSVAKMKQVVDLSPEQPDLKYDFFSKLFDRGHDDHAVAFGKDYAKPKEIVRHYNNKGVMMSKDSNVDGALTEYERALKFYPNFKENYRILYNIALAEMHKKTRQSFVEAQRAITKCLELQPEFEKGKKVLATIEKALAPKKKAS